MLVKIHKLNNRTLVAVCDEDLLGRAFEEKNAFLDIKRSFYEGEKRSEVEIGDLMRNADMINVVGNKSIKLALEEELITKEEIKEVQGIPHVQIILEHN
ncbi:DUF424 family protein [Candidatus Woesearchaeota archaeon]|nr:DUF424 family protein [Candidatus Woesearchaeota archaeon]